MVEVEVDVNNETSLISHEIKLLIDSKESFLSENGQDFFSDDCTYNWKRIKPLMDTEIYDDENINFDQIFSKEFCFKHVKSLRPVWIASEVKLKNAFESNSLLPADVYSWLDSGQSLKYVLEKSNNQQEILEKLLILTSALENGLGNVYKTITRQCPPHLLRDLLRTVHLRDCFGNSAILFLQIVMGTPNSINLRNIVWHGFPSPGEIPAYYVSVLILCLLSLTKVIKEKRLKIELRFRNAIIKSIDVNHFEASRTFLCEAIENDSENLLQNCRYITKPQIGMWQTIFTRFENEEHLIFLLLILPQLEVMLRIMYGSLNNLDITAKFDEYYITLDTLFEETTHNSKRNIVFDKLESGKLKLMYDILNSPLGPRIRDKVSHGEVDFRKIPKHLCSILMHLALCLMSDKSNEHFHLKNYESLYHPNAILYRKLLSRTEHMKNIANIKPPDAMEVEIVKDEELNKTDSKLKEIKKAKIFFRPQEEGKIVVLITQIIDNLILTSNNIVASFIDRIKLYEMKLLRSKRRETLFNMLKSLPVLCKKLNLMWFACEILFYNMQKMDTFEDISFQWTVKFLKQTLKIAENMQKYCEKSSNEWEKALKLCDKFDIEYEKYKTKSLI